jgi:hypothetical protein
MWFEIVKTLLSISDKKKELDQEKRERLSKAFDRMAEVVKDVIDQLENDVYPTGSCIAMEQISNDILKVVSGIMPQEDAKKLALELAMVSHLELEYAMRKNKETIPALYKAQGRLEALSIIYSV